MKIYLLFILALISNLVLANRVEIDLTPVQSDLYDVKKGKGTLVFNFFPNKHVFFVSNNVSKLQNPIYAKKKDKAFWLLTEAFVQILKDFKFKKSKNIYFAFLDTKNNKIYQNMFLKIELSEMQKMDNRDFSHNDDQLIQGENFKKYKLLPLRSLFKTVKVTSIRNNDLKISNELTNSYNKFIDEYTFQSIGDIEFHIESNVDEINNLKNNIHHYCISGNYNKVKLYIDLGYNINKLDDENHQTLLDYATNNGHYNLVKFLVDNGADPNIRKKGYENAYLSAKKKGFTKIAKLLKPLSTLTEAPRTSFNNYSSSDLKNMCLGASGKFKNFCYNIGDSDLKNTCIGISEHSNFCDNVGNSDLINLCRGKTRDSNDCYNISDSDMKNTCLGVTKYPDFCYSIHYPSLSRQLFQKSYFIS